VASEDRNRVWWGFDRDEIPNPGVGLEILSGLARISRGVFQPTNVREECRIIEDKEFGLDTGYCRLYFAYEGRGRMLEFLWSVKDGWEFERAMNHLNEIIRHTGYQYYQIDHPGLHIFVVLRPGEARKLNAERDWRLSHIWIPIHRPQ